MNALKAPEIEDLLSCGLDLYQAASSRIMPHFRSAVVEFKPDGSEVTIADRLAEEEIRKRLGARFPRHAIVGEEFGGSIDAHNEFTWVLDPIDGTTYFALGLPAFGTLIALLHHGEPVLGVVGFPAAREVLFAGTGLGCWHQLDNEDARRVNVAKAAAVGDAFCSASGVHASDITGAATNLSRVIAAAGKFRILGDCQQHALLCRGRIHVAIDTMMAPWDTAALVPCIREAGGIATSITGVPEGVVASGSLLATASAGLHSEVLQLMSTREA